MRKMNELVHFNKARQELALATKIDEVKAIRDKAEALRAYAKQVGKGLVMQNQCAEIKIRAERRAGELLEEQGRKPGETDKSIISHDVILSKPKLKELGIDLMQSSRWQQIASIAQGIFEEHIATIKDSRKELTSVGLQNIAKNLKRSEKFEQRKTTRLPSGKFNVIYADLPWQFDNTGLIAAAETHYDTLSIEQLSKMDIPAANNAVLFLWVTNAFIEDALKVVRAWSFEYKTNMVWIKRHLKKPGIGFYVRGRHELLFICTKGSFLPDQRGKTPIGSVIEADVQEHSRKPDVVYDIIEKMYPEGTYLELFARRKRKGWTSWGNEILS